MTAILEKIDSIMYYPILLIVLALAGIYFTVLTRGVQIRLFPESVRLLLRQKAAVYAVLHEIVYVFSHVRFELCKFRILSQELRRAHSAFCRAHALENGIIIHPPGLVDLADEAQPVLGE